MGKLKNYAIKSSIMEIYIELGDEVFKFNLNEELMISEQRIESEIMTQSNSYAFLAMLHKKLIKATKDSEMESSRVYSQQYLNWKQDIDPETQKPYNNDQAKAYAEVSKKFQDAQKKWVELQEKCNVLETCVRAFEMRKDLIQTLSANIRKTNN